MADDKLKAGPESPGEGSVGDAQTVTRPPALETVEEPAAGTGPVRQPEQSVTPGMGGDVPAQPAPQVEADKVEKSPDQDKKVEPEEKAAKRRGRPPKEQDSPQGGKPEKGPGPRTGRPAKADKAARGKSPSPGVLDKVSKGQTCPGQGGGGPRTGDQAAAHAGGAAPPGGAGKNRLFEAVRASSIPYHIPPPLKRPFFPKSGEFPLCSAPPPPRSAPCAPAGSVVY